MRLHRLPTLIAPLIIALLCASQGADAQESGAKVARVLDVKGQRLMSNRLKADRWFQAYPGMRSFLRERLRTDAKTQAVLEFDIGGVAGINHSTEVEIVSQRGVEVVGNKLVVKAGTFWAKIDKQNSQLQIQTAGGVMGIEGTELLVAHDPETKITEVLLFEGQVSLYDNDGKKTKTMSPGDYASLGGPSGVCVLSYPPTSLRTLIVERFPRFSSFLAQHNIATIPKPASPTLIRGFLKHTPSLDQVLAASNETLVTDPSQFSDGAVSGLSPSQSKVSGKPSLTWSAFPGAKSYQVVLGTDEGMEDIAFSGNSEGNSLEIPAGAPGLESGKYFYRVIPLDDKGKPMGKASQTWFETGGWESQGIAALTDQ